MTTLVLCRHGESLGNVERRFGGQGDTPLTERGRAQGAAAGRVLAHAGIDAIYTSDLPRAQETAALIGRATGVVPEATTALRERSVGELTGLTFDEAKARFPEAFAALIARERDARPPGGETYEECRARVAALLEQALEAHPGGTIVLVSHRIALSRLVCHLLELWDEADPDKPSSIDNGALHWFRNSLTGTWAVLALNDREHLQGL